MKSLRERKLKVSFMGGSQAGIIGALTILSKGHRIVAAVSYWDDLTKLLNMLGIPVCKSIHNEDFMKALRGSDILISVHGREIVKKEQLELPKLGGINAHPYLYKYKGGGGIERALRERNFKGSVGVHRMTSKLDEGRVLAEDFVNISKGKTVEEVYNRLYPYYAITLLKALGRLTRKRANDDEKNKRR